jgi:hypothetical protein
MVKYVVMWCSVSGQPLGVQYYEYKRDALAAVSHFVGLGYHVEIQKPTF